MIDFYFETDFKLQNEATLQKWISDIIISEGLELGEIVYVFCDDAYLHKLNLEYLDHDTFTDIISFDYKMGKLLNGEIYISIERVAENAKIFLTTFEDELHRVIIHGILHFCGYKDKNKNDELVMRAKENESLSLLNL
jgi:rRNA maturation RNase YbeY